MAKWLCKASRSGSSIRITLPAGLVKQAGWGDVEIIRLVVNDKLDIVMRGFVDGKDIARETETDSHGADRPPEGWG